MKAIALLLACMTINFVSTAQDTEGVTITVTVPNVTSDLGTVMFGLYDENTFMKRTPLQAQKSTIQDGVATITFTDVPRGTFGITCFHDENNNEKMDFEDSGMPKENYGISNNPMSYGPPRWPEAKFEVSDQPMKLEIRL